MTVIRSFTMKCDWCSRLSVQVEGEEEVSFAQWITVAEDRTKAAPGGAQNTSVHNYCSKECAAYGIARLPGN